MRWRSFGPPGACDWSTSATCQRSRSATSTATCWHLTISSGLLRDQITDDDTVVFLGDYIDRGPDTKGCIDSILVFQEEVAATCLPPWESRRLDAPHSGRLPAPLLDDGHGGLRYDSELLARRGGSVTSSRRGSRAVAVPHEAVVTLSSVLRQCPEEPHRILRGSCAVYQGPDGICVYIEGWISVAPVWKISRLRRSSAAPMDSQRITAAR